MKRPRGIKLAYLSFEKFRPTPFSPRTTGNSLRGKMTLVPEIAMDASSEDSRLSGQHNIAIAGTEPEAEEGLQQAQSNGRPDVMSNDELKDQQDSAKTEEHVEGVSAEVEDTLKGQEHVTTSELDADICSVVDLNVAKEGQEGALSSGENSNVTQENDNKVSVLAVEEAIDANDSETNLPNECREECRDSATRRSDGDDKSLKLNNLSEESSDNSVGQSVSHSLENTFKKHSSSASECAVTEAPLKQHLTKHSSEKTAQNVTEELTDGSSIVLKGSESSPSKMIVLETPIPDSSTNLTKQSSEIIDEEDPLFEVKDPKTTMLGTGKMDKDAVDSPQQLVDHESLNSSSCKINDPQSMIPVTQGEETTIIQHNKQNDDESQIPDDTEMRNSRDGKPKFNGSDNSLAKYRMDSLLSQSTGQVKQLSTTNNEQNPQNTRPTRATNSTVSIGSTKSDSAANLTTQDSLIFQQSGLTLNNLNSLNNATKNMHQGKFSASNRNASQQSLQRKESYLSFRVPDNQNFQFSALPAMSVNDGSKSKNGTSKTHNDINVNHTGNHVTSVNTTDNTANETTMNQPSNHTEKKKDVTSNAPNQMYHDSNRLDNRLNPPSKHTQSDTAHGNNRSLLTKQNQHPDAVPKPDKQPTIDLDLSSYLSSQESTTDSRTQQKLWLQRENVANMNDSEDSHDGLQRSIFNQNTRFQYEQFSREYLHVRRYNNPIFDSLQRINEQSDTVKTRVTIENSKPNDLPVSKSISKSLVGSTKSQRPLTANSTPQNLRLSQQGANSLDQYFKEDLEEYTDALTTLWSKNIKEFKSVHISNGQRSTPLSSVSDMQRNPPLSSRYGYQPTQSGSQHFHNVFNKGNHTSFGQPSNNHVSMTNGNGSTVQTSSHYGAINGMFQQSSRNGFQHINQQDAQRQPRHY